jgi:hypothetical protein
LLRYIQVRNAIMMSKNNKRGWIGGGVLLLPLFLFFIKVPVTVFAFDEKTYYLKEEQFRLSWIHSVEKEEWQEVYERKKKELLLTETLFKTFGAGVPADAKDVSRENGFVHMTIERKYPELYLTISENVKTSITVPGKHVPLYKLTHDYETVHIYIDNISLWTYLRGDFL